MSSVYYYGQDGLPVTDELINLFGLGSKEYRYSDKLEKNVFDFVGFVFREGKTLVVFPKHYYERSDIRGFNTAHAELHSDMRLLFSVIQRYREKEGSRATGKSYMGSQDGYDSDYPFKAFYEVYRYFQNYGLYKVQNNCIVQGTKGKIAWKETLSKSNKIISNGNLIFSPFYIKKKKFKDEFLTECMAFVIDFTIDQFRDFLNLKKTGFKYKFDFIKNREYVLRQLKTYQSYEFKDINKKLVKSMIVFFEQYSNKTYGGNSHVRIRYFDMIWQKMMMSYINRHFVDVDKSTGAAIFDVRQNKSVVTFRSVTFSDIDLSFHGYCIDVDHTAFDNGKLFIFDSKYYSEVTELNYKQFSYNELLRDYYPGTSEIYNILFLPGKYSVKEHFKYNPRYVGSRKIGTRIIEQYMLPKHIMQDYLQ